METACKDARIGKTPRLVVRGVNSQIVTEVGVHWLRISFPDKYLRKAKNIVCQVFDSEPKETIGLWGYDRSYLWPNRARLIYDVYDEKNEFHNHRSYFECPGRACDELTPSDLVLLMQFFLDSFEGRGERIDVFLDDYARRIEPRDLHELIKRKDYSRFRFAGIDQKYEGRQLFYDAVVFGSQKPGWVKQLECYDKNIESGGEKNCVRWEAKFREDKAHSVFMKLAGTSGNLDLFALLCGSIVVGSVQFLHRVPGVKNLDRLDEYDFWKSIKEGLGDLRIRTQKKVNTVNGIWRWVQRQCAPNFAVMSKIFKTKKMFYSWVVDLVSNGESRWNANQQSIVDRYSGSFGYKACVDPAELENNYLNDMCNLK